MKVRRFALRAVGVGLALTFVASGASVAFADAPTLPLTINAAGLSYTVNDAKTMDVAGFVNNVATAVNVAPVNATRNINAKKKRVDFTPPANGQALDTAGSVSALQSLIAAHSADVTTPATETVTLSVGAVQPRVTHFDKTIMVILKQRRIFLYDNTRMIKTYRCAIGMPRYPTPTGTFIIRRKVKNPSWNNPGGAWGKGMPSYIGPGPGNPLGTRALYLYRGYSDTGVRFHGTTKVGSIGHAASHGCMRMKRKDVEKFYNQVPLYTTVYIIK